MAPVRFTLQGAPLSGMISQVHLRVLESSFPVPTAMYTLNGQVFGFFRKQLEFHGH
jgi:hypothetical protein